MLYTDFHAHVAPGIDHGSADLDHSLAQLSAARSAGVGVIVATSHYYMSDGIPTAEFAARRDMALDTLRAASPDGPLLVPAAEVRLYPGLAANDGLELLAIGDTRMILIEMPYGSWEPWAYDELIAIQAERGLHIIIAHCDRYPRSYIDNLVRLGLDLQVNADAVDSFFGYRRVLPYLRSGAIKALGSDVHTLPDKSYAKFARAARRLAPFGLPYLAGDGETGETCPFWSQKGPKSGI